MCICGLKRIVFRNGTLKSSINTGRYTVDYLQCGNLPYLAWKNAHNCADLSYRRIRRYLVWRLKRLEARDFSRVRIKFLIHGISDVIDKMTENVEFADRFMNKNGSLRKTPLKKKRAISKLEFFIPEYEYRRLKKMKDPIETLERPVEHMTVYRNDGSSVTLTAENGRVSIVDSREKNVRHIIEADYFVSKIL